MVADTDGQRWTPAAVFVLWLAGAALSRHVGLWLGVGGTAVALATVLVLADHRRLLPLYADARGPTVQGLLVGAFMTLVSYPAYPLLKALAPALESDVGGLYGRFGGPVWWRPLALVPIVVAEELVWRGAVQSALRRRHGARTTVLLAAALYALAHLPVGSPFLVALAFGCALVWSGLRATTASLLAPTLAHLLWDQVVLVIAPLR